MLTEMVFTDTVKVNNDISLQFANKRDNKARTCSADLVCRKHVINYFKYSVLLYYQSSSATERLLLVILWVTDFGQPSI